jgi:uncharacterized protein YkwD
MFRIIILALIVGLFSFSDLYAQKVKDRMKAPQTIAAGPTQSNASATPNSAGSSKTGPAANCSNPNGLTAVEIEAVLAAHNIARTEAGSPLLTWNCSLAAWAQDWANRGVAQHREFSDYGENIFVAGDAKIAAKDAVNRWLMERPQWNNSTGSCAEGKICTHYTQVVWKRTTKIGCGINRNATGKWKVLIVCNYDPAGNNQPGAAF